MNVNEFREIIRRAESLTSQPRVGVVKAFWDTFGGWEAADFSAAVEKCIATSKFFPSASEILQSHPSGNPEVLAQMAWRHAVDHVRDMGRAFVFDDPVLQACVRLTGSVCFWTNAKTHELEQFKKPEFVRNYVRLFGTSIPKDLSAPMDVSRPPSWVRRSCKVLRVEYDTPMKTPEDVLLLDVVSPLASIGDETVSQLSSNFKA